MERKLAAILCADVFGYSRLMCRPFEFCPTRRLPLPMDPANFAPR